MPYPLSSDVSPAQPTLAAQYNNLRSDALRLGQLNADAVDLARFFKAYMQGITLVYLATNRLRINYDAKNPPTLMINGFMLQAYANVDLAAGLFSGAAATWYVFAVRTAGSSTFTLSVNTSPVEGTDQRLIGQVAWDGANISNITNLNSAAQLLPIADYDSGWFAVASSGTYGKSHGLGQIPRLVILLWCANANGASANVPVYTVVSSTPASGPSTPISMDGSVVQINTGVGTGGTTCYSQVVQSAAGYHRVLAWK